MPGERIYRSHYSFKSRLAAKLLPRTGGKGYQFFGHALNAFYRRRLFRRVLEVPNPLVLVGGDRFGGSGKTPIAQYIATYLAYHRPVTLVVRPTSGRRFQGVIQSTDDANAVGDECVMLYQQRVQGLEILAVSDFQEVPRLSQEGNVLVLDDGLRSGLYGDRCLRIMLTDGGRSVGPYRHSYKDIHGIGMVWMHRSDPPTAVLNGIDMVTAYSPELLINVDGESKSVEWLMGRKVIIAAGIGNPEPFIEMILNTHAEVQAVYIFADHEHFDFSKLSPSGCVVVTTEKDLYRMRTIERASVYALRVKLEFIKGAQTIRSCLKSIILDE